MTIYYTFIDWILRLKYSWPSSKHRQTASYLCDWDRLHSTIYLSLNNIGNGNVYGGPTQEVGWVGLNVVGPTNNCCIY